MTTPILCTWDGEAFRPHPHHHNAVNAQFVVGQTYIMAEMQERSIASHQHEFASLRDAWANLPENISADFPTPEHLRKRALVETGWYHQNDIVCSTNAEAIRWIQRLRARKNAGRAA